MSSDKGTETSGGGSKLPWIPPRFEGFILDDVTDGHAYYDTDDVTSAGSGRGFLGVNPHSSWDQTNPYNS